MTKRPSTDSPLVAAALAFDEELATYARLAEQLLAAPLTTARQLERANETIQKVGDTEERLRTTGQQLAQAIAAARDSQQQLADRMIAHLPAVHARNQELRGVVDELGKIAEETRALNAATSGGDAAVQEIETRVTSLAERAEQLATRARTAGFEEIASQAHAVHQQLLAAGRKLHAVTSRLS